MKKEECIFCRIAKGEIPSKYIYENHNFISFPDANPAVKGHSLVISKEHFQTSLDLPSTMGQELLDCIKKTTLNLMDNDETISGFNVLANNFEAAGQVVKHVHFHILPRRKGDNFKVAG